QDGGGHAYAKHQANEQKHHVVGIGRGGQGRLAQIFTHPHGVDRAVERLQDVARQNWQRKNQQGAGNGALGEITGGVLGHAEIVRRSSATSARQRLRLSPCAVV